MKWYLKHESKLLFIELQHPYTHLQLIEIPSLHSAYTLLGESTTFNMRYLGPRKARKSC